MPWDDETRFRITTWPREPIPLPAPHALAGEVFYSSVTPEYDDWENPDAKRTGYARTSEYYDLEVGWDWESVAFGEVYLELYALDLRDPAAIFEFVEKYSSLSVRSLHYGDEVYG